MLPQVLMLLPLAWPMLALLWLADRLQTVKVSPNSLVGLGRP